MFFSRIKILIIFVVISLIIICLLMYINTTLTNLIAAVFGAIVASITVSAFYNEELHKAMDRYKRIGLIEYYDNFEDAHNTIKEKISKATSVDIFVMYGDSFLNTSTKAIQSLLSKENTKLRYFMYSSQNKFIEAYGYHWGEVDVNPKYNTDGLKSKIKNVKSDLKRIIKSKHESSSFGLFEIQSAPMSYSFYIVDNEVFFVPNKNIRLKEFKPSVFQFKKTNLDNSMFTKLKTEIDKMISTEEALKIEL